MLGFHFSKHRGETGSTLAGCSLYYHSSLGKMILPGLSLQDSSPTPLVVNIVVTYIENTRLEGRVDKTTLLLKLFALS